jgi:hypothetical protein
MYLILLFILSIKYIDLYRLFLSLLLMVTFHICNATQRCNGARKRIVEPMKKIYCRCDKFSSHLRYSPISLSYALTKGYRAASLC